MKIVVIDSTNHIVRQYSIIHQIINLLGGTHTWNKIY